MRTPGLAAITLAFAIAACSDVAAPTAMITDPTSVGAVAHKSAQQDYGHKLGDKKDQCDDNDHDRRWGKRYYHSRFRPWGWRHDRRNWHFRGHDDNDCETQPPPVATGTISGSVMNEGEAAPGFGVFLLNADGSVAANALTDATGAYSFASAAAGTYLVCEENPFTEAHGFLGEARPATGGACPGTAYAPRGFSVTLAGGATVAANNFSNMSLN